MISEERIKKVLDMGYWTICPHCKKHGLIKYWYAELDSGRVLGFVSEIGKCAYCNKLEDDP